MAQKRKPDIALKDYWRDEAHFSDLYNAVLFGGKQVILPQDLEEGDADVSCVLEHGKAVANIKAFRDIIKIVKHSKKHNVKIRKKGILCVHFLMNWRENADRKEKGLEKSVE